ncbi:MAG: hypothetical protein R3Y05_05820 [bacterium]
MKRNNLKTIHNELTINTIEDLKKNDLVSVFGGNNFNETITNDLEDITTKQKQLISSFSFLLSDLICGGSEELEKNYFLLKSLNDSMILNYINILTLFETLLKLNPNLTYTEIFQNGK